MEIFIRSFSSENLEGKGASGLIPGEMHISKGRVLSLGDTAPGYRVACRSGLIWLTRENDIEDYLVGTGAMLVVNGSGKIVIEALKDSIVSIEPFLHEKEYAGRISPQSTK